MQREDNIWRGIDERLLHLVSSDGSTVSDHVPPRDHYQQAEFAFSARRPVSMDAVSKDPARSREFVDLTEPPGRQ